MRARGERKPGTSLTFANWSEDNHQNAGGTQEASSGATALWKNPAFGLWNGESRLQKFCQDLVVRSELPAPKRGVVTSPMPGLHSLGAWRFSSRKTNTECGGKFFAAFENPNASSSVLDPRKASITFQDLQAAQRWNLGRNVCSFPLA